MVRQNPGHDTQGEPSGPAQAGDSLPLNTPDEAEIALFTIHGPAHGGKVQDVRRAQRLTLPDLDLNSSAELQALAASLMKNADGAETSAAALSAPHDKETAAAGDLPLGNAPVDQLVLTADDPGLEWFDDETELAASTAPSATANAARWKSAASLVHRGAGDLLARLLTLLQSIAVWLGRGMGVARTTVRGARAIAGRLPAHVATLRAASVRVKRSSERILRSWSRVALLSARIEAFDAASRLKRIRQSARHALSDVGAQSERLASSARHAWSEVPLDDVIRGALVTAALVTIAVVLARIDWTRPGALSDLIAETPAALTLLPEAPSASADGEALAVEPLAVLGRLAPSVEHRMVSGDLPVEAGDAIETTAANVRGEAGQELSRDASRSAAARLPEPSAPEPEARRALTSDIAEASAVTPPAPAALAGIAPMVDAPPAPVADAVRTEALPADTTASLAERPVPTEVPAEADAIVAALGQLELAYERRDAQLAKAIWPTVDARALARAFDSLRSQSVEFDGCQVKVAGGTGEVQCRGTTTYVPRIGSQLARTESRQWMFRLEKGSDRWVITQAAAR